MNTTVNTSVMSAIGIFGLCLLSQFADGAAAGTADASEPYIAPEAGVLFLSTSQDGRLIWDLSRVSDRERTNLEFPYLIRFKGHWYCSFREGDRHGNDPSGRARVIRSEDGRQWQTAALIEWEGGDVRDPRMSVTSDGQLMINSSIYFIGDPKPDPEPWEQPGHRQSVTWLSENGADWSGPYACSTGFDTWRWDVAWHDGVGYSVGYSAKDRRGALYRTEDGKTWETVVREFFPQGRGTEAALVFDRVGIAYCLLRPAGNQADYGMFGVGQPPDYAQWQWHPTRIDAARNGQIESGAAFGKRTGSIVGGQKLLRLNDGRIVAAVAKGGLDLFWVDPQRALFTRFVRMADGVSYPGLAEHDGQLWITNAQRAAPGLSVKSGIYLTRLQTPPVASFQQLLEVAQTTAAQDIVGFGRPYRDELRSTWRDLRESTSNAEEDAAGAWAARQRLLQALGADKSVHDLTHAATQALAAAQTALADATPGFGTGYADQLRDRIATLKKMLGDDQATLAKVKQHIGQVQAAVEQFQFAQRAHARAEGALARSTSLMRQSADGFARVFQNHLGDHADRLRAVLAEPGATIKVIHQHIEALLDAAAELRAVDQSMPLRIVEVADTPMTLVTDAPDEWQNGASANVTIEQDTLVLKKRPVILFGDGAATTVRVTAPRRIGTLGDAFTITAWALPYATDTSYRTIIDKGGRDAGFSIRHGRTLANNNGINIRMYAEGEPAPHAPYGGQFRPDDPVDFDGRWHHYAATYDGQMLRLYIDGQLVHASPKPGRMDLSQGDLCFGTLATGNEPWRGSIQDVTVWSHPLSASELASQQDRPLTGAEPGLVGYWPLDEGDGDVTHDRSDSREHGHIHRGQWRALPARYGWRISNPIHVGAGRNVRECIITWDAAADHEDADVSLHFGLTQDADTLPHRWNRLTQGADITAPIDGQTLSGRYLWLRQTLRADHPDHAPRLHRITIDVK